MTQMTCPGNGIHPLDVIKTCMSILDFTYHPHPSKLFANITVKSKKIWFDSTTICSPIRHQVNVADDATSFHVPKYDVQYQSNGHNIQYTWTGNMNVASYECTMEYKVSSGKFLGVTAEASSSTPTGNLIMLGMPVATVGILVAAYCLCYKSPQADNSTGLMSSFHMSHIAPQQYQQQEVDTPQQQHHQQEYSMQQQQPPQNATVMSSSQGCPNRTCARWTIYIGIIGAVAGAIIWVIGIVVFVTDVSDCRSNCHSTSDMPNLVRGLGAWMGGYILCLSCLITSCIGCCCLCYSPPQLKRDGNVAFPQYPQQAPPNQVRVAMDANESGNGPLGVEFKPLADNGASMPPPPAAAPPPPRPPNEACQGALGVDPGLMENVQAGNGVELGANEADDGVLGVESTPMELNADCKV